MHHQILLLGSDARQLQLSLLLQERGFHAIHADRLHGSFFDALQHGSLLLLPYPVSRNRKTVAGTTPAVDCDALFSALQPKQTVCGGGFSLQQRQQLQSSGVRFLDYADSESFLQCNAHLTAQGALRLLLETCNALLSEQHVLLTGYGRIGAALAARLTALHCDVCVAARSDVQRTKAALSGCKTTDYPSLSQLLPQFDVIINTVPHRLFSSDDAARCKPGVRYLELASAPGGADPADFGACYMGGAALPGRFTPRRSAETIFSMLEPLLKEGDSS